MTDRELLEKAAKAAGLALKPMEMKNVCHQGDDRFIGFMTDPEQWPRGWFEPLTNDGDALRLAVKLGLVVDCSRPSAALPFKMHIGPQHDGTDPYAATRRAIVRAAAAIGETP